VFALSEKPFPLIRRFRPETVHIVNDLQKGTAIRAGVYNLFQGIFFAATADTFKPRAVFHFIHGRGFGHIWIVNNRPVNIND
jgi:hypothetical protein